MRNVVLGALLLIVTTTGCTQPAADEFTTADGEQIRQRTQQLATAFNAKQIDSILELYADNSVFMPPNAPVLRGREPLRAFYQDLISRATNLRLETEDVSGHGPIAYETGSYSLVYQDGATRDRGKFIFIWRQMNDRWVTEKTIWSSDLPPQTPVK